jgi:hypothetical protein
VLVIEDVTDGGDVIVVRARTRDVAVACPECGTETARVHGYHERTAADVPVDGRRVQVRVRARRLRCTAPGCPRQTFREQVPGVLERYQRRTARLTGQVSAVARELAGRASARLLSALGIAVSRHVALRVLLRIPAARPGGAARAGDRLIPTLGLSRLLVAAVMDAVVAGVCETAWGGPGRDNHRLSRKASRLSGGR